MFFSGLHSCFIFTAAGSYEGRYLILSPCPASGNCSLVKQSSPSKEGGHCVSGYCLFLHVRNCKSCE